MRAIMIMYDSLKRNMLPPYGCKEVHAPNFTRLAEKTVRFNKSYVGSMPCMPARRELHTGRLNFLHRSWGPLEPFDDSMPEILKRSGIHSHLISDHYHYWEDGGATYHQRYSTWEIVRGQEADHWKPIVNPDDPPEHLGRYFYRDYVNRQFIDTEEKQPQSITFDLGLEFLEMNKDKDDWFLQIETFDPHEPYYTMDKYKDLYPHSYDGPHFDWPDYKPATEGQEALNHLRNEYKALVSMCDHNLGKILDYMDEHEMWDDTMLIVNTDHGFLLGEHDWLGKVVMPYYDEIARTPLFYYDPRVKQQAVENDCLVQTIDLCPTVLDFFGRDIPSDVQGQSLKKVVESGESAHDSVLFGQFGAQVNVTDGRYVYMRACERSDNQPLNQYTLMTSDHTDFIKLEELRSASLSEPFSFTKDCKLLKIKANVFTPGSMGDSSMNNEIFESVLYDTEIDPAQRCPINDIELEQRMVGLMVKKMKENDAPLEQFTRLGLTQ